MRAPSFKRAQATWTGSPGLRSLGVQLQQAAVPPYRAPASPCLLSAFLGPASVCLLRLGSPTSPTRHSPGRCSVHVADGDAVVAAGGRTPGTGRLVGPICISWGRAGVRPVAKGRPWCFMGEKLRGKGSLWHIRAPGALRGHVGRLAEAQV